MLVHKALRHILEGEGAVSCACDALNAQKPGMDDIDTGPAAIVHPFDIPSLLKRKCDN